MLADPPRVLIVDDEPVVCKCIKHGLVQAGFDCRTVTRGMEAQSLIRSGLYPVVVTDIKMPDISGLDLLSWAVKEDAHCRFILITGNEDPVVIRRAMQLGAFDYFPKPLDVGELADAVALAMDTESDEEEHLSAHVTRAIREEKKNRKAVLESIQALVRAVEAKDPYTSHHSRQVAHYAVCLAEYMRMPPETVESVRVASLVHDMGKIGIPDHVLTKPGPLSRDEFKQLITHPAVGADILKNISVFAEEARIVRGHHERWDGQGYPDGLSGKDIPEGARLVNVADAIDAMLMNRSYKEAYSVHTVLDELIRCAGHQFDPEIAWSAESWCRENPKKLIRPSMAS